MANVVFVFAAALVAGSACTRLVRYFAKRYGAVDHALVSRKIHRRPIPRLGGVAIVAAFFGALALLAATRGGVLEAIRGGGTLAIGFALGAGILVAVGIYDDLGGVRARHKLAIQFGAAAIAYAAGFQIDEIALPVGPLIRLGALSFPFTLIWIAGVINALNLIDGLDGLAGGVAVLAAIATGTLAAIQGDALTLLAAAALAGAAVGFLFYNFHPATIFMGDTGSMFLGFALATMTIRASASAAGTVSFLFPLIVLGLPIADTVLAMARRTARGVPMFLGDRDHIHHRLLDRGLSHSRTVVALYVATAILGVMATLAVLAPGSLGLYLLGGLALLSFLALRKLGYVNLAAATDFRQLRQRNLDLRGTIRAVGESVRSARNLDEFWRATQQIAPALGANCIGISLGASIPKAPPSVYELGFDDASTAIFRVRYSLDPERPGNDFIELGWSDGRSKIDRDTEIAIELLCEHLSTAVGRLRESSSAGYANVVNLRS